MMNELGWKPLNERRKEQRLVLLFKIVNDLVAIPADNNIEYFLMDWHSTMILTGVSKHFLFGLTGVLSVSVSVLYWKLT
jgi:hypothetical protein